MRAFTVGISLALLVGVVSQGLAGEVELRQALQTKFPNNKIDRIAPSEIPGLFEVTFGENIIYTNEEARYFIFGHIYDTKERKDLTAARAATLAPTAVKNASAKNLPAQDGFTIVRGDGSRRLSVFVDPLCGYCRQMERELAALENASITFYLMPMLSERSRAIAEKVWCADNRGTAWRRWMIDGVEPATAPKTCTPGPVLDRNLALANQLGIRGTPTVVLPDGTISPGAQSAAMLKLLLK